ncbi:hypothetical protein BH10CYA1_BH10CYA1_56220 [soil metagenome]
MAKPIPNEELKAIESVLKRHPEGITLNFIATELGEKVPRRTLQYRLHYLIERGRAIATGQTRAVKYLPQSPNVAAAHSLTEYASSTVPFDPLAITTQRQTVDVGPAMSSQETIALLIGMMSSTNSQTVEEWNALRLRLDQERTSDRKLFNE